MSIITSPLLLGADSGGISQISRSLRFNSADSAYLNRTPASAGNRQTWTWSGWVKRSELGYKVIFAAGVNIGGSGNHTILFVNSNNKLCAYDYTGASYNFNRVSTAVYRDLSAWYHIVIYVDSNNGTAANRFKAYVNGVEITAWDTNDNAGASGYNTAANNNVNHFLSQADSYFDGYLADIHFIDGQALTPNSFVATDATTGKLLPRVYNGTYGTNGWKLSFSNNSTAAALGTDSSGNGNTWTVNNLSVAPTGALGYYVKDVTGTPFDSNTIAANAFDGSLVTESLAASGTSMTWTPSPAISASSTIRLYLFKRSSGSTLTLNGVSIAAAAGAVIANDSAGWYTISGTTITSLVWARTAAPADWRLRAVEVDGVILLDPSAPSFSGNDSLVDTPTSYGTDTGVGGEVRGNYATLNPLVGGANIGQATFANGNLDVTWSAANFYAVVLGSIGVDSGKWYWETLITGDSNFWLFGIASANVSLTTYIGGDISGYGYYSVSGNIYNNNTFSVYGNTYTTGDIIGIAFDADNGKVFFAKNGTWQNSGNPAAGTNAAFTGLTGRFFPAYAEGTEAAATAYTCNFGQRAWVYTAPTGFKALCDTNLPTPVIAKPNTVMDTVLYTGNGAARSITGLAFNPDLVWLKSRSAATDHKLTDSVRGVTKSLVSNSTAAETTDTNGLTVFNSDGFSLGTDTNYNNNAEAYVAWAWDAGTSTVTNTAGSISSQVKANASAGFSVVTWTGTGTNATVGHGLGVAPNMVIVKRRDTTSNWQVRHISIAAADSIQLNLSNAAASATTVWNSTAPTSTVFSVGTDATVNASAGTYVAYCFSPVAGYSSFGSYTGNGSADGPFVHLGFRPACVIVKMSSSTGNWTILDDKRAGYNVDNNPLYPNLSNAEGTTDLIDITSNGFKVRTTDATFNTSTGTYVYAAWASSPFAYSRAR